MKLLAKHIRPLPRYQKDLVHSLLAPIQKTRRRDNYIAQSTSYVPGDEKVLPYPELCSRGRWLDLMFQSLEKSQMGVLLGPTCPDTVSYLQQKLRAKYSPMKVFHASREEILSCIYALQVSPSRTPFSYWRDHEPLSHLGPVPNKCIFALDPPSTIFKSNEYTTCAAFTRPSGNLDYIIRALREKPEDQLVQDPLIDDIRQLARAGLTKARPLECGLWLQRASK